MHQLGCMMRSKKWALVEMAHPSGLETCHGVQTLLQHTVGCSDPAACQRSESRGLLLATWWLVSGAIRHLGVASVHVNSEIVPGILMQTTPQGSDDISRTNGERVAVEIEDLFHWYDVSALIAEQQVVSVGTTWASAFGCSLCIGTPRALPPSQPDRKWLAVDLLEVWVYRVAAVDCSEPSSMVSREAKPNGRT